MESILLLIAQFLTPVVKGLDVVPFDGDPRDYEFTHPVGVVLLKLDEENRLTVSLPFRTSAIRVAGDYLDLIQRALAQGIPLHESPTIQFTFERNHYAGFDKARDINFHASTYLVLPPAGTVETPAEPVAASHAEEAE